ncbi:UDP-2,3-diacylglucosamine diphosphatase [Moritella sp. F3]|uniref:UDP-2,3-diacylglucosamine diphosphatase n=1 Tax=Moritella sp. F3 TaxID=2718882 RepID=UPI0018E1A240|nr:UDP-2,3-diacylglucosamine diphosphatase [Moritella sp. F3]GIC76810.1 UDP-2,3-diacylglucosamine hydrolase [Moritella sp. F1]GIC80996.1 UDP-2,3-diacylglucosamine hydrolase [Moritella sp. F3]
MTTLFISDLHLDDRRPQITELFLHFLATEARQADALYILGDLFEFWSGDDISNPLNDSVQDGLKALTASGVKCFLVKGNRDFLVSKRFAKRTGMTILGDYTAINLDGQNVLIAHGDTFCTLDEKYQAFRTAVNIPWRQKLFTALPIFVREAIADKIRGKSKAGNQQKSMNIMDVTESEVISKMLEFKCDTLIHGHTHKPYIHDVALSANKQGKRIVLGDWFDQGSVLVWNEGKYDLQQRAFLAK